jgi:hypothetical protein
MLKCSRLTVAWSTVIAVGLALATAIPASAETYSGRAYGIMLGPPLLSPTVLCDTGELPSGGGSLSDFVANGSASVSGQVVAATSLDCAATAASAVTQCVSDVQGLTLDLAAGLFFTTVTAARVRTTGEAGCDGQTGGTVIDGLTIGGVEVTVTGEANQVVDIPGIATLVINEQVAGEGELTVNGLHLTLLGGVECIVACVNVGVGACPPLPVEQSTWGKVKALYR